MAATTITRESMTNGVTVWNVARIGSAIYDRIDSLIAADITFGGLVNAEGFGAHIFSAGSTGQQKLQVRNTSSGTSNLSALDAGNNSTALLTRLMATSSAYTPSSYLLASCSVLEANGAGGLSVAATDASGTIRFYPGASTAARVTMGTDGRVTQTRATIWTPESVAVNVAGTISPTTQAGVIEMTDGVGFPGTGDVYGLTAGTTGQMVTLVNVTGASTFTLKHENAGASAAARFQNPSDGDVALAVGEAANYIYSGTLSRWVACLG